MMNLLQVNKNLLPFLRYSLPLSSTAAADAAAAPVKIISTPMGEHTISTSHRHPAAAAAAGSELLSSSIALLPAVPAAVTATAKIPLRPRKHRKISSSDDDAAANPIVPAPAPPPRLIPRPLSADGEIAAALRHLRAADPYLSPVIDSHDPPVLHVSFSPFHTLVRSIISQQLSNKAAETVYGRFFSLCGDSDAGVVPDAVLALNALQLRQVGISARKASYLHDLAKKYQTGVLSDASVVAMDDKSLLTMLTMVKGIGAWSVQMFMIFSLHRPDVLPVGDLGVRKGVQVLYGLEDMPRPSQMEALCERWRPYRSVGAWYMWRLKDAQGLAGIAGAGGAAAAEAQPELSEVELIDPLHMLPNLG